MDVSYTFAAVATGFLAVLFGPLVVSTIARIALEDPTKRTGELRRKLGSASGGARIREMPEDIECREGIWKNSRGMGLFWQRLRPKSSPPKALLFVCHGFSDCIHWFQRDDCIRYAQAGYITMAQDFEAHGKSDGTFLFLPNVEEACNDIYEHFKQVRMNSDFK
ncbi:hypothetical protein CYMTET_32038, partial [Cymbomonas tetramitiformis]